MKIFLGNSTAIQHYILNMKTDGKICIITDNPLYSRLKGTYIFMIHAIDDHLPLNLFKEFDCMIIEINRLLLNLSYRFGLTFTRKIARKFFEKIRSFCIANQIEVYIFINIEGIDKNSFKTIFIPNWIKAEKIYLD